MIEWAQYKDIINDPKANEYWSYMQLKTGKMDLIRMEKWIWDEQEAGIIVETPYITIKIIRGVDYKGHNEEEIDSS